MTDLGRLQLEIDSTQARAADQELAKLEQRAGSVEQKFTSLTGSVDRTEREILTFSQTTNRSTRLVDQYGRELDQTRGSVDRFGSGLDESESELRQMGSALAQAESRIRDYANSLDLAQKELRELGGRLNRTETDFRKFATEQLALANSGRGVLAQNAAIGASFTSLGFRANELASALGLVGGAFLAAQGIRSAISNIQAFETTLAQVQAIAIPTTQTLAEQEAQYASLSAQARILGATTKFTATQAGEAQLFLARAGFQVNDILSAVPATLDIASAGYLELGEAADIASNVLSQFSLAATELADVGDVLVATANKSNTDIRQLAEGLKFAGPFAGALGKSVRETASALGILGNAGIQASLAGTNLRGILVGLLSPATIEAAATLDNLAGSVGKTRDAFDVTKRSLSEVFATFKQAQAGPKELEAIFGRLNVSAAAALTSQADALSKLTTDLDAVSGSARRLSDVVSQTLTGSFLSLLSATQNLGLVVGDAGLKGGLRAIIETSAAVLRSFGGVATEADKTSASIQFFTGAAQVAGGALLGIATPAAIAGIASLGKGIAALTIRVLGLNTAFGAFGFAVPLATVGALIGAFAGLAYALSDTRSQAERLADELRDTNQGLGGVTDAADRAREALEKLSAAREGDDPAQGFQAANAALQAQIALLEELRIARGRATRGDEVEPTVGIRLLAGVDILSAQDQAAINQQIEAARKRIEAEVSRVFADPLEFTTQGFEQGFAGLFDPTRLDTKSFNVIFGEVQSRLKQLEGLTEGTRTQLSDAFAEQATAPIRALSDALRQAAPELDIEVGQIEKAIREFEKIAVGVELGDSSLRDELRKALSVAGIGKGTAAALTAEVDLVIKEAGTTFSRVDKALSEGLFLDRLFGGDLAKIPDEFRIPLSLAEGIVKKSVENIGAEAQGLNDAAIELARAAEAAKGDITGDGAEADALRSIQALREQIKLQTDVVRLSDAEAEVVATLSRVKEAAAKAGLSNEERQQIEAEIEALLRKRQAIEAEQEALNRATSYVADAAERIQVSEQEIRALQEKRSALAPLTAEQEIALAQEKALQEVEGASITTKFGLVAAITAITQRQLEANAALREEQEIARAIASDSGVIERLEAEAESLRRQVDALQGKSDATRLEIELANLSTQATNEQRDAVARLVEEIKALTEVKQEEQEASRGSNEVNRTAGDTYQQLSERQLAAIQINRNFVSGLSDVITGAKTGKEALAGFIQQLVNLVLQQQLLNLFAGVGGAGGVGGGLSGLLGFANSKGNVYSGNRITGFAKGGVFDGNHIRHYALGGIPGFDDMLAKQVREFAFGGLPGLRELPRIGSQPALFQTPDGRVNSLREGNQPEGILPLGRDSQGRLGVRITESSGSGPGGVSQVNQITDITNFNLRTDDDSLRLNPRQVRREVGKQQRRFR